MSYFGRLAAMCAAVTVMFAGGSALAQAEGTPPVYTTPGGQISNGRLWNTTCEKYSSTVVRCRAEIWATVVTYENGHYVKNTGWAFNNLSYLPASRSAWSDNNLGKPTENWVSDGHVWRTECDTAVTGTGGCRTYIKTGVISEKKTPSGVRFSKQREWVFNNLVLFSSRSIPAVKRVPEWIIDQSRLSFTGLGPLQVGALMKDLEKLGYARDVIRVCQFWPASQSLRNRGVYLQQDFEPDVVQRLSEISVYKPGIRTTAGAQVGMTLAEVRAIYGSDLELDTKEGVPDEVYTAIVRQGANELVFTAPYELERPLRDSDVITEMVAREYRPYLGNVC